MGIRIHRPIIIGVAALSLLTGPPGCSKEGTLFSGTPSQDPCSGIRGTDLGKVLGCPPAVGSAGVCGIPDDRECSSFGTLWTGITVKDGCTYQGSTMTVTGYVRDFLSDNLVPGAEVTIMNNDTGEPYPLCATSDSMGKAVIEDVPLTTIGYRVIADPSTYKVTYKFNITADEAQNNRIPDLAATALTFETVNAPTAEVIALQIPITLDHSKAVVAGTVKGGSWAGDGLKGFTVTTDPQAPSVNYIGIDGNPKCNPTYQGSCPSGGIAETTLGDPTRDNKGAGVFVAFNVAVGQKVSMTAWLGAFPSATTSVFPYADSVCISNMAVPQ